MRAGRDGLGTQEVRKQETGLEDMLLRSEFPVRAASSSSLEDSNLHRLVLFTWWHDCGLWPSRSLNLQPHAPSLTHKGQAASSAEPL